MLLMIRLSPAEPHFPILFPILVQPDHFIFLENRINIVTPLQNPIADSRCDTQTFLRQSYLSSDIRITHSGMHVEVRTPTNTTHGKNLITTTNTQFMNNECSSS